MVFSIQLLNFRIEIQWGLKSAAKTLHWQDFLEHSIIINSMNGALASVRCSALWPVLYRHRVLIVPGSSFGVIVWPTYHECCSSLGAVHWFLTYFVRKARFYCPWQQKKGPVTNDFFAVTGFCGTKPICQRGFSISSNDVTLSPLINY